MPEATRCCDCQREVCYVRDAVSNRFVVIDAEADPGGNVHLDAEGRATVMRGMLFDQQFPDGKFYRLHGCTRTRRGAK